MYNNGFTVCFLVVGAVRYLEWIWAWTEGEDWFEQRKGLSGAILCDFWVRVVIFRPPYRLFGDYLVWAVSGWWCSGFIKKARNIGSWLVVHHFSWLGNALSLVPALNPALTTSFLLLFLERWGWVVVADWKSES